jgi:aerobic carbon-monoxide dehydrogenase large subunit
MCTCEVDPATGAVTILRYVVSEDCGVMINPNVVEGQIAGGVVQGIGGVLYEHSAYDDAGNPLATTFVDYLLPTAAEVPVIEYGHIETPAPTNPGGHKGMGEGGAMASPPRRRQRGGRCAGAARGDGPEPTARPQRGRLADRLEQELMR